jgi:DNA mismatch repair protein MutL
MPIIRRLPQSLINKIAAGEVIERPASVVKELMENSVDAGASRIDVYVEAGGVNLVRVVDNGSGIAADDLPLAVASHATSKIIEADDLFRVRTLGFRGEALASIAEVSRLVIRSRTPGATDGFEITVQGGTASEVVPCGCPVGTTVDVRDLIFNTPVRRKFLRSTPTELGHTSEAFIRVALASPHIHCTLWHNDRPVFELPGNQGWLQRIERIFGRELADSLIPVESEDGPVRISGYVAHPSQSRSNNRMQYLFLNGRCIRDRSLQHALGEAYRGLLLSGRYPIAILSLEVPADWVDVNVHPTKSEVRFQDSGRLYSQLLAALRTRFLATDLTPRVPATPEAAAAAVACGPHDPAAAQRVQQQLVDWAKGQVASWGDRYGGVTEIAGASASADRTAAGPRSLEITRLDPPWRSHPGHPSEVSAAVGREEAHVALDEQGPLGRTSAVAAVGPVKALQVHNRYLVAESEDGVLVIDQHALHERILYERLRERLAAGAVESQSLLVPEPVDLAPAEAAAALEHRELLGQLGLKIEPFGGGTVLVVAYPAMLANVAPAEVLRGLVDRLVSGGKLPDRRDLLDDLLHMIACKAAIKAGDRLTPEEVAALVAQRHLIDDAHHCPHGRPTALVFSRDELDKHFKRI